jgi:hypothetical protein
LFFGLFWDSLVDAAFTSGEIALFPLVQCFLGDAGTAPRSCDATYLLVQRLREKSAKRKAPRERNIFDREYFARSTVASAFRFAAYLIDMNV